MKFPPKNAENETVSSDNEQEVEQSGKMDDGEAERNIEAAMIKNQNDSVAELTSEEALQLENIPFEMNTNISFKNDINDQGKISSTEQTSDENVIVKEITKSNNLIIENENIPEVNQNDNKKIN